MSKTDPFREGYDLTLGQDRSNRCRNRGGLRVSGSLSVRSTRNVPSSRDVLVVLMPLVSLACSNSSHNGGATTAGVACAQGHMIQGR